MSHMHLLLLWDLDTSETHAFIEGAISSDMEFGNPQSSNKYLM